MYLLTYIMTTEDQAQHDDRCNSADLCIVFKVTSKVKVSLHLIPTNESLKTPIFAVMAYRAHFLHTCFKWYERACREGGSVLDTVGSRCRVQCYGYIRNLISCPCPPTTL